MNALKLTTIASCFAIMASCSSSKTTAVPQVNNDEVEINQLCYQKTDDENLFANAVAQSTDMQMAKDKAINSARAEIATATEAIVDRFIKRYRKDVNEILDQKEEDRLQIAVKQTLVYSVIDCERITRTTDGKYRGYATVKLSKKGIKDALEKGVLENKELKLNFDQSQFDKIADDAMKAAEIK